MSNGSQEDFGRDVDVQRQLTQLCVSVESIKVRIETFLEKQALTDERLHNLEDGKTARRICRSDDCDPHVILHGTSEDPGIIGRVKSLRDDVDTMREHGRGAFGWLMGLAMLVLAGMIGAWIERKIGK